MQEVFDIKKFGNLTVLDENSKVIKLSDLWKDKTTILAFLRHFGCIACRAHVSQLSEIRDQIKSQGAQIMYIGNGSPHFIKAFKEDLHIADEVYTDPSLKVFHAAQLKRNAWDTIGPKAALKALKLFAQGHRQTGIQGDSFQQGGMLVISPQNKLLFQHISSSTGDYASEKDVLKALT